MIDISRLAAVLRQWGGLGAIGGSLPTSATTGLPWQQRVVMFIAGAIMFYLEHQNAASPTSLTPPNPPKPVATTTYPVATVTTQPGPVPNAS